MAALGSVGIFMTLSPVVLLEEVPPPVTELAVAAEQARVGEAAEGVELFF
jgi:hypothetical protein